MNIKTYDRTAQGLSIIETILCHRGIAREDIPHFLHTTDDDILNPLLLKNMREGQELVQKHLDNNSKILVWVDCDVDGYCSAAIFINYFHKLRPSAQIDYILSIGKQHGIIPDRISDEYKLIVAPDSSSSSFEEHKALKARGIDILCLDHHIADFESEDAIVINNQLCDYPTKSLSGAGIVYKFCQYFDSVAGTAYANEFLDLSALALIGDMMDQRDFETQHIIRKGLRNIKNNFFDAMVQKNGFSLGDVVTPIGVAFYIVPYMNATIRCGTEEEKLILFESLLDFKGLDLVPSTKRGHEEGEMETKIEQACRNCTNIKKRQTSARDASLDEIEQKIKNENLLDDKVLIIKLNDLNVNPNIRGLIANQIMGKYQRPVMMITHDPKTDLWEGSCRGCGLESFKNFLEKSGLMAYTIGHANALGCGILNINLPYLRDYANAQLADFDFSPSYKVDFVYDSKDLNPNDIFAIAECKSIWGTELPEALVEIKDIYVSGANVQLMSRDKNPTLKITLKNGVSLIKFKSSETEYEQLCSNLGCVKIDIVGKCNINQYQGVSTPQIFIEDYQIVERQDYYF